MADAHENGFFTNQFENKANLRSHLEGSCFSDPNADAALAAADC